MAVINFRCERCGKLVSAPAEGDRTRCPNCRKRLEVPQALRTLPSPQIARSLPQAAAAAVAAQEAPPREAQEVEKVMAGVMPWVMSMFFHISVLVVLAFLTLMIVHEPTEAKVGPPPRVDFTPDPTNVGKLDFPPGPGWTKKMPGINPDKPENKLKKGKLGNPWNDDSDTRLHKDRAGNDDRIGATKSQVDVIGLDKGGGTAKFEGDAGGVGKPGFFNTGRRGIGRGGPDEDGDGGDGGGGGGNYYHIVYVLDRSGSMLDSLDAVRLELIRSISRLSPRQDFHVIWYNDGQPKENPPSRLVPASDDNKRESAAFLKTVTAVGQTDVIPAMKRAFAVLNAAPDNKGKLIYLLTDGEFSDNEKVLKEVKSLNAAGNVKVCTILYHHRSPEAEKVLRQMAIDSGAGAGGFRFVD